MTDGETPEVTPFARSARGVAAAAGLGAFFALVGPPTDLAFTAWVGMAGLAFLLRETPPGPRPRAWDGAARGLAFGTAANAVFLRFVPPVIELAKGP